MGGGGGGGRRLTSDEYRRVLEQTAKNTLSRSSSGKRNVFVSFASEDLDEVNMLRGQAKNENSNIEFNDFSLRKPFDSKDADYIKRGIRERIRQSSVTIVYLSKYTASSMWVEWEIKESIALGKGVVAMYKEDRPPALLPKAVVDNKIPLVPWNQKALAKAIEDHSKNR